MPAACRADRRIRPSGGLPASMRSIGISMPWSTALRSRCINGASSLSRMSRSTWSGFALDLQSHLLAQRASQVAHHARHAAQAIAEGPHAAGQRRVVQALRQMPHAPAELVDLGRAFGQLALGLLDDALGVVQRRLHPRVDRLAGQRAARAPSSACPAPACMRRSRSMDALNGAIQCDSTSVSLDSPSSLFKVSAVTRSTRSPSASAWSLDRRSGAGSGGAGGGSPGRCSGGRKSDGRSRGGAGDASGGRLGALLRRSTSWSISAPSSTPGVATRCSRSVPSSSASISLACRRSRPSCAATRQSSIACAMRTAAGRRCAPPLERMRRACRLPAARPRSGRAPAPAGRCSAPAPGCGFPWNSSAGTRLASGPGSRQTPFQSLHQQGFIQDAHAVAPQRHPAQYFRLAPATVAGKGSKPLRSTE